ncbi:MAG: DNA polymerase III subunit delta [Planctomycetaceae bacterium]|nr:DNA polymerase III subunit delta [Planctomycetaceae bacterium]|tara:strand:- start:218 stop:1321 length:1104 start_codon:yes stop_codon:yes gene_type:complete
MPALHVFDLLRSPEKAPTSGLCVLVGMDYFLHRQATNTILTKASPAGTDNVRYFDDLPEWAEVIDEVSTASLFGGDGIQVAVVPNVDKRTLNREAFLKTNKDRLIKYAKADYHPGLMILEAGSFPGNTSLYKKLSPENRVIDCRIPEPSTWKKEEQAIRDKAVKWVSIWAKKAHNLTLGQDAAALMLELSHSNTGIVEMNLLKLVLLLEEGATVSVQQVQEFVSGWHQKNTFEMVDTAVTGNSGEALRLLDNLLREGQASQQIFGGMSYSYRRFVRMTRGMQRYRRQGLSGNQAVQQCLADELGGAAKFRGKFTRGQLSSLGSARITHFMRWLLEADLDLKHKFSRSTLPLEKLLIYLDREFQPPKA